MKYFPVLKACLLLFLFTISFNAKAQTTGELIASTKVLENAATNALDKADNILSDQQRTLYINILNYTGYIMGNVKYMMNDLSRKLTEQELALFNEINSITNKLREDVNNMQVLLQDVTTIIAAAPSRIPFADRTPTPTFYNIPLITTVQNKVINIDIKGIRLKHPGNHIVFNGKRINPYSVPTDALMLFSVPLTQLDVFKTNELNTFKVVLYQDQAFGSDKEFVYTPRFVVAPISVGSTKVFYNVHYEDTEYSNDHFDEVSATSKSNKEKEVKKQFNVQNSSSDNWRIDRNSIICKKVKGSGDKHGKGGPYKKTITDISFVAKAYAKDGKAVCRCTWNEYRMVPKDSTATSTVTVNYNQQHVVELPKNTTHIIKSEVSFYDGSVYQTMDASFKRGFIDFKFDNLRKMYQVGFSGI